MVRFPYPLSTLLALTPPLVACSVEAGGSGLFDGDTGGGAEDDVGDTADNSPDSGQVPGDMPSPEDPDDPNDPDDPDDEGQPEEPDPPPDLGSCSVFATGAQFADWVGDLRTTYSDHERFKGNPDAGQYHSVWTFPTTFVWDEGLADQARVEAQAIANGQVQPTGLRIERLFFDGLGTADWTITLDEQPDDWTEIPWTFGDMPFPLHKSNPVARKGLHYHDFGGDGPVISRVGIGGAIAGAGDCQVWWVLRFSV